MSTRSSSLVYSPSPTSAVQSRASRSSTVAGDPRLIKLMKSLYQADQQVKYLHLQAEVESLLQQLEIVKQQRLHSITPDDDHQE